jgi:hypothetical protein
MVRELRRAARVPFPAKARLERLLERMFDYVLAHPGTHRLLLDEAVLAADDGLTPLATAARTELTAEVAGLLAGTAPLDEVAAASVGVVGFALANIGLCLSGALDAEQAKHVTCEFCTSQLPDQPPARRAPRKK